MRDEELIADESDPTERACFRLQRSFTDRRSRRSVEHAQHAVLRQVHQLIQRQRERRLTQTSLLAQVPFLAQGHGSQFLQFIEETNQLGWEREVCRSTQPRRSWGVWMNSISSGKWARSPIVIGFQLFWLAKLCQDMLLQATGVGELLLKLLQHPAATSISKGKILEIPERRFGMPDLREEQIKGASEWLAWCSAVGSREIANAERNQLLTYFAKGSWFNRVVADCVTTLN